MGSISHTDRYCAALVGRAADWAGIGLDLEPAAGLDADLWPEILTDAERADLATLPTEAQPLAAKTVFCIKEAVYKAQYPVSRTLFGFHTLHVTVTAGGFSARFLQGVPGFALGRQVSGRLFCTRAVCGALCWLPAGQVEKMP